MTGLTTALMALLSASHTAVVPSHRRQDLDVLHRVEAHLGELAL